MARTQLFMDIRVGPNLLALTEIIRAVNDLADLVPEWNQVERTEAMERISDNANVMLRSVGVVRRPEP